MRLFLLRHGIAIDRDEPDCPDDPQRFLTELGRERTEKAARGLASLGCAPDGILSSPYLRAAETAEIAAGALGFAGAIEHTGALIWMMPPKKIVKELATRSERTLLLVGHAPHLDELVAYLCGSKRAFTLIKKAAVIELECLELEEGGGFLVAHYPPRALRAFADSSD